MKVYVASSWRNEQQPLVVSRIKEAGFEVYDFRHPAPQNTGFHWSEIHPEWRQWTPVEFRTALAHPVAAEGFQLDMEALTAADVAVLVMPCGRSAHLEAGYCAGSGKPLIILLDHDSEPELMYRMAASICIGIDEVIMALQHTSVRS